MPQAKLSLTNLEFEQAQSINIQLTEFVIPPAQAVTTFETGSSWQVEAYYADLESATEAEAELSAMSDVAPRSLEVSEVPEENWVALSQAGLPPVQAGRFRICGSHDLHRVPAGPGRLVVEAGEAFGTAHHATTLGCLQALDQLFRRKTYRRILDLGTGSGVLALACKRVQRDNGQVVATDIDPIAIEVAKSNAIANQHGHIGNGLTLDVCDGCNSQAVRRQAPYDLIIANILAAPLFQLATGITQSLRPGGQVILSGLLDEQARSIIARYHSNGMDLQAHLRLYGWSILTLRKRKHRPESSLSGRFGTI